MTPTQIRMMHHHDPSSKDSMWKQTTDPLGELNDGEIQVRLEWISVDPGMMGWVTNKRSYMDAVNPGDVMRAFGIGEVLESKSAEFEAGDWIMGFTGIQSVANLKQDGTIRKVDTTLVEPRLYVSGFGWTGYTAYFGMMDIGKPKEGQTVVVSAAAGAVGSVAAQLARNAGARVIGIAGGPEKVQYLLDELKLDAAIDYKNENVFERLTELTPDWINVYFDNVGGEILDAVLTRIAYKGVIALCGGISQYGDMSNAAGPSQYLQLIAQSARLQGFTMRDYLERIPEAFMSLYQAHNEGNLAFREHVVDGIENFPEAFDMLFSGKNHGKLLLKV